MTTSTIEHIRAPLPSSVSGEPAGLSLRTSSEAAPLAVGDVVEWKRGYSTELTAQEQVKLEDLMSLPSKKGVVTSIREDGIIYVEYSGVHWWHNLGHEKWGNILHIVRLSDGEKF